MASLKTHTGNCLAFSLDDISDLQAAPGCLRSSGIAMSCITLSHNRHMRSHADIRCLPACCGRRVASQSETRYPRCLAQGLPGSSRGSRTQATPSAPSFGWSRLLPVRHRTADQGLQTASCTHTHTHTNKALHGLKDELTQWWKFNYCLFGASQQNS